MAGDRISRNDPCPCGSGKKFKHCCIDKGDHPGPAKLLPAAPCRGEAAPPGGDFLGPFGVSDAKLKEVARATPEPAARKERVERLSERTPGPERLETYRLVRQAAVLPDDAAGFLFGHAAEMLSGEGGFNELDRHIVALLRRHGQDDLADLVTRDRLEYDRRYERGRQFFHGPPDEHLAARLREMGVID
jgi:hypothetical protein